jgi:carbon-monoxide dehydrogenase large subunit
MSALRADPYKRTTLTTEPNPTRFGSGQAVRRLEDESLLSGAGRYTDDVALPNQAHLVFLRSSYPHARILSVDTSAAVSMPGVLRVITGAEMAQAGVKPMPGAAGFKRADGGDSASPPRYPLAHERTRFVGEAVAAVVAETVQQARDAAEAIMVDYEDLPMVVDLASATADGAPQLCDEATGNIAAEMRHGSSDAATAAFAKASHVVALDVNNQRVVALTIEPRSVLAARDGQSGRLTIRMSTQMPSGVRDSVCAAIGLAKDKVRVVVGDVGGGFGMKTGAYPEDIASPLPRCNSKRPVKWVADRSEEFLSSATAATSAQRRAGARRTARSSRCAAHAGQRRRLRHRHRRGHPAADRALGADQRLRHPLVDFHFQAVLTNTAPTGAYRGAGRPEAIFTMERLMDEAARQTGIDRIVLRRRNFIRPEQMPYKNPMGADLRRRQLREVMDQALALADWRASRGAPRESRRATASCAAWASPPSSSGPAATCSRSASPSRCRPTA